MIIEKTESGYRVTAGGGFAENANETCIYPRLVFELDHEPVVVERKENYQEWTYGTLEEVGTKYKAGEVEFVVTRSIFSPEGDNSHRENYEAVEFLAGEEKVRWID